jgi:hypothetical protein
LNKTSCGGFTGLGIFQQVNVDDRITELLEYIPNIVLVTVATSKVNFFARVGGSWSPRASGIV